MRYSYLTLSGLILCLVLTACEHVSTRQDQRLDTMMTKLDGSQQQQQVILERINNLEKQILGSEKGSADYQYTLNQILDELSTIRKQLEDSTQRLNSLYDKVTFLQKGLDDLKVKGVSTTSGSEVPSQSAPALNPEMVYQTAYNDYLKNNFQLAITGFQQFISRYPDTELAGNAQYWIGESYYSLKKYNEALGEFEKVEKLYPGSNKVASALLKRAYCFLELGKTYDGKKLLSQVIQKYPSSREAMLAQQRLQQLD